MIGIIVSEFNGFVTEKLLAGCLTALKEADIAEDQIVIAKVPGAFEIPWQAQKMANTCKFQVLMALGCVIRGDTRHFEEVCRACTDGLMQVQLQTEVPMVFEVLMVDKVEDAIKRASDKMEDNKGYNAGKVALKLVEAN